MFGILGAKTACWSGALESEKTEDQDESTEILEEFHGRIADARRARQAWADEARQSYKMYDGHQWSASDMAHLESQNRPAVTFNRIAPAVDVIVGQEMNNRQEARYYPRTHSGQMPGDDDAPLAELLTETVRYVRQRCDAAEEESDTFEDALKCGMGWSRLRFDFDDDPQGRIVVERVDPFKMFWDPAAIRRNLIDAEWIACAETYTKNQIKAEWPDKWEEIQRDIAASDIEGAEPHNADDAWKYEGGQSDVELWKKGLYRVYEYQYVRYEPVYKWNSPDTDPEEMDELSGPDYRAKVKEYTDMGTKAEKSRADWDRLHAGEDVKPEMDPDEIDQTMQTVSTYAPALAKAVKLRKRCVYRCAISGGVILEGPEKAAGETNFTYECITGKRDQTKHMFYGLLRSMKDPQDWSNKFFSTLMDYFMANAKGGNIIEEDAVSNKHKFEQAYNEPGANTYVNPGGLDKIRPKQPPVFPNTLDRLLEKAEDAVRATSGINVEVIGYGGGANTPGVTVNQRIRQGFAILSRFFDSLRLMRKRQGRTMMLFVKKYMPDQTIARVVGSELAGPLQFSKDKLFLDYDIVVDEAPASPNRKMENWLILQQMLPTLANMGIPPQVWMEVLKESPLPTGLVNDILEAAKQAQGAQTAPPPPQPQGGVGGVAGGRPPEQ